MLIDVTMTATLRPEIVRKTLSTYKRMFTEDNSYVLYINIDPIGEHVQQEEIYMIAKQFFHKVIPNFPKEAGFCKAFKWCIENTTSDYIFHLEDDWELLRPININSLINLMNMNREIGSLRLNRGFVLPFSETTLELKTAHGPRFRKINSSYTSMVEGFIEHPDVSFNPGLFRGDYIRKVSKQLVPPKNPEDQFLELYYKKRWDLIPSLIQTIYIGEGLEIATRDIGRKWMDKSRYTKPDAGFTFWEGK